MNPFKQFRNYFIGEALAKTEDVFEKVRIEVLCNFTLFFLLNNIPYLFVSVNATVPFLLGIGTTIALIVVLVILKKTSNIRVASYFFLINFTIADVGHYVINNGNIEAQGVLFFLLFAMCGYLLLNTRWGLAITVFVIAFSFLGVYNKITNHSVWNFPPEVGDPAQTGPMLYFIIIPLVLNIYLVSQFVKARQKAEKQISEQKVQLQKSNNELELQKHEIISSLNYAKRIQYAVLPNEETINRNIPLSFIFYRPKDIVSGDFFWFHEINRDNYIIVCGDCTGHGVPGALMTVIGSNLLTQIVIEGNKTNPSEILTELDLKITATLKQEKEHDHIIQDGMDLSLVKVNKAKKEFVFTSAKRPAIFIKDKQMQEFKGSKNTLGGLRSGTKLFEEVKMNFDDGDALYLFTDGVTDQFGGDKSKKYTIKRFRELLMNIHSLPAPEQKQKLENEMKQWVGLNEQTDDITAIGIKF